MTYTTGTFTFTETYCANILNANILNANTLNAIRSA